MCTGGCGQGLHGTVVDADTGRPLANAQVEISNNRWGFSGGRLVKDKSYTTQTRSDAAGKFHLPVDGGTNLTVNAEGHPEVVTSACPSPMTVRVGGPYWDSRSNGNASIGVDGARNRFGWSFVGSGRRVPESEADLVLVGNADWRTRDVVLEAPRGLQFIDGAGNPPQAPSTGYVGRLKIDFEKCGWLFVQTLNGVVAVDPKGVIEEDPDGSRLLLLIYRKPGTAIGGDGSGRLQR